MDKKSNEDLAPPEITTITRTRTGYVVLSHSSETKKIRIFVEMKLFDKRN
jgi:hypothetical protein